MRQYITLILLNLFLVCAPLQAQVLRSAANDPNAPHYRGSSPRITPELVATVKEMQALLLVMQQGDLSPSEQQAALEELIRANELILRQHSTWLDWQQPQTVNSVAVLLERMVFEEAVELAHSEQGREQVLRNAPAHLDMEAGNTQAEPDYNPPLLAPISVTARKIQPSQSLTDPTDNDSKTNETAAGAIIAAEPMAPAPEKAADGDGEASVPGLGIKAAVLADSKATTDMHEDNAVLRDVTNSKGELVLFGKLRLWVVLRLLTRYPDLFRSDSHRYP